MAWLAFVFREKLPPKYDFLTDLGHAHEFTKGRRHRATGFYHSGRGVMAGV
jgi:hypothetical protein